jgi:hypothetical protein
MRPQTLKYEKENGDQVVRLDGTDTFLVHVSKIELGNLFTPTIFVEGIDETRIKFDFFKAYKNIEDIVLHCEYRSAHGEQYKLIIHTQ